MSTVLVTGSSDGIGAKVAHLVAEQGHRVVLHARDDARARRCRAWGPTDADLVVGDLASLSSTRDMAAELRRIGPLDVVVHNAGWASRDDSRPVTEDGLEQTFQVNLLAPFLLTALLPLPGRLVFVSSDSVSRGTIGLDDLQHESAWTADSAYADSKLELAALAFAIARRYPSVLSNAVHPGWVRTKMSGDEAPLDVSQGADTPAWLATSTDSAATVSGAFFHNRRAIDVNPQASDRRLQDGLLQGCAELCAAALPPTD
jgi:NAD(P)-dependent dehydrogenase (short-subunit alcohol dehydrogenase family)